MRGARPALLPTRTPRSSPTARTPVPELGRRATSLRKLGYTNVREYAEGKETGRPACRWRPPSPCSHHGGSGHHGPATAGPLRVLAVLAVIAATLAGGYLAFVSFRQDRELSVGDDPPVGLPRPQGRARHLRAARRLGRALRGDPAPRPPARRPAHDRPRRRCRRSRAAAPLDVGDVRAEARDAIAAYLRTLIASWSLPALALGLLTAFAVRDRARPELRCTIAAAVGDGGGAWASALVVLLPPRGEIDKPQYYAYGADIPRALDAVAAVQRSARGARPGARRAARRPRPPGHRAGGPPADRGPAADDDRLRPAQQRARAPDPRARGRRRAGVLRRRPDRPRHAARERAARARVTRTGEPFVFVTGNHDSDRSRGSWPATARSCSPARPAQARTAATGRSINEVAGLRVAGYDDPFERRAADDFADRFTAASRRPEQQQAFAHWLRASSATSTSCMVHKPALIDGRARRAEASAAARAARSSSSATRTRPALAPRSRASTVINGGSIGARRDGQPRGRATEARPRAAELRRREAASSRSPWTWSRSTRARGAATARRERLDEPASSEGEISSATS